MSLAPKAYKRGLCSAMNSAATTNEIKASETAALESIFFALSSLPSPSAIANSGAPPVPTRNANEEIMIVMGEQTPTAASAISPIFSSAPFITITPPMFPTYMRSTIE